MPGNGSTRVTERCDHNLFKLGWPLKAGQVHVKPRE
jgi:hypothetical protein